jgi:two-component system, chemotaxis family, response regulator Rcp1
MSNLARIRPVHLLIIEDNPGDVRLLEEAFGELHANVKIKVAKDGAEAIALVAGNSQAKEPSPDLILLDLNLPKINGHDVLVKIKSDPRTRHIPVIILTSSRAESDVRRAYQSHANAYLRKPSTLEGLLNTARDVKNFWMETATLPT